MQEREKKIQLTAKEYAVLLCSLNGEAVHAVQTNYYYDTDDFIMNKTGTTCRVREKNGKYKATVKKHSFGTECSEEKSFEVSKEVYLNVFKDIGLGLQGILVTDRTVLHQDKYCQMVADCNTYLGVTDYELEIEYACGYEKAAKALLLYCVEILKSNIKDFDENKFLESVGKGLSKYQRFFKEKQNIKRAVSES